MGFDLIVDIIRNLWFHTRANRKPDLLWQMSLESRFADVRLDFVVVDSWLEKQRAHWEKRFDQLDTCLHDLKENKNVG